MEQRVLGSDGRNLSAGTWEYKPPSALDIPIRLNVSLLSDAGNDAGILKSKASGEPPYSLCFSVYFAVKNAIRAARKEFELNENKFTLGFPATVARIRQACEVSTMDMLLG